MTITTGLILKMNMGVSATFNVYEFTPFDADNELDSMTDSSKVGENDMNQDTLILESIDATGCNQLTFEISRFQDSFTRF